jgi:hypothetical protein
MHSHTVIRRDWSVEEREPWPAPVAGPELLEYAALAPEVEHSRLEVRLVRQTGLLFEHECLHKNDRNPPPALGGGLGTPGLVRGRYILADQHRSRLTAGRIMMMLAIRMQALFITVLN